MKGFKIELEIYADSLEEAEQGRKALISFIELMRRHGAAVRGAKLHEAVNNIDKNALIKSQIINFFK